MELDEYRRMAAAGDSHWWYRSTRALLQGLVEPLLPPINEHTVYLDAGGGTGATGRWLAERATTVLDDFEPMALSFASAKTPGYQGVQADLNSLPHHDEAFDVVLCVTALCHRMNPDPAAIVREFARISKPGGLVCLMEPGGKRLWRGHDVVTHTARRFSIRELRDMVQAAGLHLERATGAYSFLLPPAALLGLLERGSAKSDVGRNESGLGGLLGAAARIERRLLHRIDMPAGLSAIAIGRKPS